MQLVFWQFSQDKHLETKNVLSYEKNYKDFFITLLDIFTVSQLKC